METDIPLARGIVDTHLVELRDVFPTLVDFAGSNVSHLVDGDSMFDLLRNPDTVNWRTYIDMELTSCGFNITQTWNAITDGEIKYVYWWYDGYENLFNLTSDPYEQYDLGRKDTALTTKWRDKLIDHFESEGRDNTWVGSDGDLQTTPKCWYKDYLPAWPCYISRPDANTCSTS